MLTRTQGRVVGSNLACCCCHSAGYRPLVTLITKRCQEVRSRAICSSCILFFVAASSLRPSCSRVSLSSGVRHNGILETGAISVPNVADIRQLRCCCHVEQALRSSYSFDDIVICAMVKPGDTEHFPPSEPCLVHNIHTERNLCHDFFF